MRALILFGLLMIPFIYAAEMSAAQIAAAKDQCFISTLVYTGKRFVEDGFKMLGSCLVSDKSRADFGNCLTQIGLLLIFKTPEKISSLKCIKDPRVVEVKNCLIKTFSGISSSLAGTKPLTIVCNLPDDLYRVAIEPIVTGLTGASEALAIDIVQDCSTAKTCYDVTDCGKHATGCVGAIIPSGKCTCAECFDYRTCTDDADCGNMHNACVDNECRCYKRVHDLNLNWILFCYHTTCRSSADCHGLTCGLGRCKCG